jgi:hypothetical protein
VEIDPCRSAGGLPNLGSVSRSETPTLPALVVDPTAVARAAGRSLDASADLGDAARAFLPAVAPPATAFGDGPGAHALGRAHRAAADALADVMAGVGQVLEGDADRLYRVAFAVRAADDLAGRRLSRLAARGRGPTVARW